MNTDLFLGRFGVGTLVLWVFCQGTMTRDRMGTGHIQDRPLSSVFSSPYHVTPRCKLPSGLEKLAREICISLSVSEVQFLLLVYLFWIWPLPDGPFCQRSVELLIFSLAVWTALCGFH